jgi:inorganic pyrophosphatase
MNLWHDVPIGENAPNEFNVIIEIPKGSNNKYEIDKETGLIALDRANYNAASYPTDYGFAPQTYWEDGDALDVLVLTTFPIHPGILVPVRPVALMEMTDCGDPDSKVICVPVNDRRWEDVQDVTDLNKHTLKEFQHFFETYKALKSDSPEKHTVTVHGFKDKKAAMEAVAHSMELYQQKLHHDK